MSEIFLVGLSHHTAPVAVREQLAIARDELPKALRQVRDDAGLGEAVLLSTCNRVELYGSSKDSVRAADAVTQILAGRLPEPHTADILYSHHGKDAVRHSFRVAASLDSLVVGEPQILGQVKEAYEAATAAGTLGSLLSRCFSRAFAVAKRVRSETGIAEGAVSISSIACELARKIFGDLDRRRVLLIGAGEMGETAARALRQTGALLHVVNRDQSRAERLAESAGGRTAPYEQLVAEISAADVIISSTASPHFILTPDTMQQVVRARRHRPLFIIDIAVPRDVDPRVAEMDNVFVYDVDDLQKVAEENRATREREAALAERIVAEEVIAFENWRRSLQLTPTIVALRERFSEIMDGELERTNAKLQHLSAEDREALKQMTHAAINKLLHEPLSALRQVSYETDDSTLLIATVRRLFDLQDQEAEQPEPQTDTSLADLAAATGREPK